MIFEEISFSSKLEFIIHIMQSAYQTSTEIYFIGHAAILDIKQEMNNQKSMLYD